MAFSFAAILPSDQYVNEPLNASAVETEPGCCADEHVGTRILFGIYDNVRDVSQFFDGTLGRIRAYLLAAGKFFDVWGSASVEPCTSVYPSGKMDLDDTRAHPHDDLA